MKRIQVPKFRGVYYRESEQSKRDRCFDIAYTLPGGKLKWEKIGWTSEGYTAQAAATIRGERIQALRHGEELPQKKQEPTFGELWLAYDKWLDTAKKSAATDRYIYEGHLKRRFVNKTVSQISPFDLDKLKIEMGKRGYSQATIKHCLVLMQHVVNLAITWGKWRGENPVKRIKLPKLNNRRERFLSREEANQLLSELKKVSVQIHDIALLSLYTGMRAGEIFALRWNHLDFQNDLIHIADPKGGEARKAFMTFTIKTMLQSRNPEQVRSQDHVFKSRSGDKIRWVSDTYSRVADNLFNVGIEDTRQRVCFHSCRHTFASWLALQGTPLLTLKELMGHKTIEMTMRYAHLIPDQKRQAVNQLEQYLSEKEPEKEPATA